MMTRILMITSTVVFVLLAGNVQGAGRVDKGADLSFDCIECHGMKGQGTWETPALAGLSESHITSKLRGFNSGKIKSMDGIMHTYTEDLTDQQLQDLGAYWSTIKKEQD